MFDVVLSIKQDITMQIQGALVMKLVDIKDLKYSSLSI